MSIFKKETPNPQWTQYYKLNPLGENIPVYIENGIQITHIMADNRPVEIRLSVPEKDEPETPQEPMRRFRVYDHDLQEILKQQDDYSFRTDTGYEMGGTIMKKIYKFRVILSVKSYNEGELYEREIKNILKFYGEEAWIATAGLLSSNTMSVNVMVLTTDSTLGDIKSDIANTTGFEIKEGY